MTRDEIEAALKWADWLAMAKDPGPTLAMAKVSAPTLAAAVRSLRETVKGLQDSNEALKLEGTVNDYAGKAVSRMLAEEEATVRARNLEIAELRETVKAKDEEIARLKLSWDSAEAQIDDVDDELREVVKENAALRKKLHEAGINPSLDAALNEGDGSYKP